MANLEVLALDEATPQIRAPGSGDGYTMPRPLAIGIGTITTDIKVLDLSVTWNNAAVTFGGLKLNATDTASNAASLLLDLQAGGTSKFSVRKNGLITVTDGVPITCSNWLILNGSGNTGEVNGIAIRNNKFSMGSGFEFAWSTTTGANGNQNGGTLFSGGSHTIDQRQGANAQTSRLYRTYTDASNYQRLTETWSTSTAVIHNEGAGTGADGSIAFNDAALATDATKGFIMIPSCAGTPTGTPADIPTGQVPIVFDSTNNKIYVYDGGWLATAALS